MKKGANGGEIGIGNKVVEKMGEEIADPKDKIGGAKILTGRKVLE
mgnify:CR=1 FL=1